MTVDALVEVQQLRKVFRVSQRTQSGMWSSVKGFVHRQHTDVVAVDGVDLSVATGEIRALIGPNGAGKSTIIKVLSGILHPTAGQVRCLGVTPWADRTSYVRRIGAVFGQKTQLLWDLPAVDTFALNQKIYRIPRARYRRNLEYFVDTFGLAAVLAKPVRNLSLGERMKCELTAALLHEPPLVFLDEPTIGLDILAKEAVREFVKQVNAERAATFLLTTHDLDDVAELCRRITVINQGTVVFDSTVDELRTSYAGGKVLELRLTGPVDKKLMRQWNAVTRSATVWTVYLDGEQDCTAEISAILNTLPVQDIEIKSPPIEAVIRHLYASPDHR
jgi:ABC-2 type transport system ATP-binding protein